VAVNFGPKVNPELSSTVFGSDDFTIAKTAIVTMLTVASENSALNNFFTGT